MRNILEELGVNYSSYKLEDTWLDYYVNNYVQCRANFSESLTILQSLFNIKEDKVLAKSYEVSNNDFLDPSFMIKFWNNVDSYIKENSSDDWNFSYITIEDTEKYLDQYDDFPEDYKTINIHAYVKSFDQFTSQEQEDAIKNMRYCELKLKEGKESLEGYLK